MGGSAQLGEKEISYVRGEFRATAEHNGHSPLLAEAMVDPDVAVFLAFDDDTPRVVSSSEVEQLRRSDPGARIETVSEKGKLLTMTTTEAERVGFANSAPSSLDEFIRSLGFDPADKVVTHVSWSENIVRFLTHPVIAGLLLTFGVLGVFFELQTPTWGISGTIGAVCLLLFFGGHYLAGLAGIADVLLFVLGLALLALELFVIPGFGLAGISGLLCIVIGIYLALVQKPIPRFSWDYELLGSTLSTFLVVLLLITIGIIALWKMIPDSRFRQLLVLSTSELAKEGYTASESREALAGATGKSLSHLRPAGRALIRGEPVEVQTEGEFIEKGTPLRVVKVVGNKVFVAANEEDMPS
jgi:membrane-bound serine protease (ClpP class)